jgi:hypothetical protein
MLEGLQRKDLQSFFLEYLDELEGKYINDNQEYNLSPDEELAFYKKHAKKWVLTLMILKMNLGRLLSRDWKIIIQNEF